MPYEIPQNLKYKEKILFGLTFKQLVFIALFGGLGAFAFFKTNLMFEIKIAVVIITGLLAVGFAFFNFLEVIQNIIKFQRSIKKAHGLDPRLSQLVNVKKIENDIVYLNDGNAAVILQVIPINFSILRVEEQNAVIQAYRDFLNSLDFPI